MADLVPSVTVESRDTESEIRLRLSVISRLSALVLLSAGGGMELPDIVLVLLLCHL